MWRHGWLAAIAIPLVLLVGLPPSSWYAEHEDDHECAICHAGRQTGDLPGPLGLVAAHTPRPVEPEPEVRGVPTRRSVRRPARAPPA